MLRTLSRITHIDALYSCRGVASGDRLLGALNKTSQSKQSFSSIVTNRLTAVRNTAAISKWTPENVIFSSPSTKSTEAIYRSISTSRAALFLSKNDKTIPENDPEKGQLVYIGTLSNMVKLVKGFSVTSSFIILCFQPYLYSRAVDLPVMLKLAMGGFMSFFMLLTPIMLHYITKRYVTKLYYNSDTEVFTATTLTFFVNDKDLTFKSCDVVIPEIPGLFITVKVNGTPLFVDPSLFLNREGYIKLMGYDKPIDWRMPSKEKKEE